MQFNISSFFVKFLNFLFYSFTFNMFTVGVELFKRYEGRKSCVCESHSLQPWVCAEIIRREKSLACANFLPPLQNKIIKRLCVRQKAGDPHGAWVSASCHEYSCGVSHDKTQKVVLSLRLSRSTLVTAAVCLCWRVWMCVSVFGCAVARVCLCCSFFFFALACCLAVFPVSL